MISMQGMHVCLGVCVDLVIREASLAPTFRLIAVREQAEEYHILVG